MHTDALFIYANRKFAQRVFYMYMTIESLHSVPSVVCVHIKFAMHRNSVSAERDGPFGTPVVSAHK